MDHADKYAFVSHESACEALRAVKGNEPRWPSRQRMLPIRKHCVTNQRDFKKLASTVPLETYGIASRPVDLLVCEGSARSSGKGARFHVWARPITPGAFLRVAPSLLVSSPEYVILQLCSSQAKLDQCLDHFAKEVKAERDALDYLGINEVPPLESPTAWERKRRIVMATLVACEFAGTYRLGVGESEVQYRTPPLLSFEDLTKALMPTASSFMRRGIQAVVDMAFEGSASPRETALALTLSMPIAYGGFGLPKPQLNAEVSCAGTSDFLSSRTGLHPNMLWDDHKVLLEYDSDEFHQSSLRLAIDASRTNTFAAMGYRVLRVTTGLLRSLGDVELLAHQLASCLGTELAKPTPIEQRRREKIVPELFGWVSRS